MGDLPEQYLPPCSRSQTVPNMSTISTEDDEREITTPDSLLSDTKDTAPDSPMSHVMTMSKTPDSALVSTDNITTRSAGAGLCLGLMRKNARTSYAWQNSNDAGSDVNEAWNGMIENENEAVRDRLADLEKKVHLQNDEIVCLKATLADCLRRLNTLEVDKDHVEICSPPSRHLSQAQLQPPGSKIPQRRPMSAVTSRNIDRRTSYSSETERAVSARHGGRRSVLYNSNTSLNSDHSSVTNTNNCVPPVARQHTRFSTSAAPRLFTPSNNNSSSSGHHHRKMTGSMGKLHKKWRSTSDFDRGAAGTPTLSLYRKSTTGGSSLSFRSVNSPFSSQHNLTRESQSHVSLSHVPKSPQYSEEEGVLRVFVRNKAINLQCPSHLRDSYNLDSPTSAPRQRLKLEWVYGYRGRDARCNLMLLPTGEMLYFVSSVVVLYNCEEQTQRHYLGHTEDIKCMSVHPNRCVVATGQGPGYYRREGQSHIRVWNSVSLQTLAVLGLGEFKRAVSSLSFSKTDGGSYLVSVDDSPDHLLSVWDWQRGVKQIESKCTSETVVSVEWHPVEDGAIVSCGRGHVSFWQIDPSYSTISRKTGVLDPRDKPKYFTSLAFSFSGDVITGDSNGNIFIWARGYNAVTKALWKVHDGPIFSICVMKDGGIISGGGKDGRIIVFDSSFCQTGNEAQLPDHLGSIRTVSQGAGSQLLVGTTKNSILTGSLDLSFQEVMVGHLEEVSALACRPNQAQFLTAGHDRMLHLWDSLSHSIVWSNDVGEQVQSACFSCDGEVVVVGTVTGKWVVLDSRTKDVFGVHQDGAEPILSVKFSPDGSMLVLVSRAAVHLYTVEDGHQKYVRSGRCQLQSSFLSNVDWSEDSQYFRVNNAERETLVVTRSLCRLVTDTELTRDIVWVTSDCSMTWDTVGAWSADRGLVSTCRSCEGALLAAGDDTGHVSLYRYPAHLPGAGHHTYPGHSSEVARLAFLADDTRLISVGGKDCAIMQWEID